MPTILELSQRDIHNKLEGRTLSTVSKHPPLSMLLIQGARVGLLRLRGDHAGDSGYAHDDLEVGMYCVYRNDNQGVGPSPSQCPIRLGRIMRIIDEDSEPFAMISAWWPVLKPHKFGERINVFGTWVMSCTPISSGGAPTKKPKTSGVGVDSVVMVKLCDVLVWPIDAEDGHSSSEGGLRIPLSTFHHLRDVHGVDMADPRYSFADRGREFFLEVASALHNDCIYDSHE